MLRNSHLFMLACGVCLSGALLPTLIESWWSAVYIIISIICAILASLCSEAETAQLKNK